MGRERRMCEKEDVEGCMEKEFDTYSHTYIPVHHHTLTPATKAYLYKWQRHLEYDHSSCCPSCYGYTEKCCSQSHYTAHCPAISLLRRRRKEGGEGEEDERGGGRWEGRDGGGGRRE